MATAPAVTEAVNAALKGGGGGGSSTSGFLRAALQRGKAQRYQEERSSLLGGVPLPQCRLVAGGANEAREGNWAGVGDREEIQKGAVTCWKSQDELWHVRSHLFFSFDKYILSASYVPGRAVDTEIRTRSKPGKNPCPFMEMTWRGKDQDLGDFLDVSLLRWKET